MSGLSRRQLLKSALCATAGSGSFASLFPKLAMAQAAASVRHLQGNDYRALVCIYLVGGNDCFSNIVPNRIGDAARAQYEESRRGTGTGPGGGQQNPSDLRLAASTLLPLTPAGGGELILNGSRYGLHPSMGGLAQLFNQQRAAIIANVGTLVRPTNVADYHTSGYPLPAQLFDHAQQIVLSNSPRGDQVGRVGWGGRLAELYTASGINTNPVGLSMTISMDGENVFQSAPTVAPFFLSDWGLDRIWEVTPGRPLRNPLLALLTAPHAHPMEREYATRLRRSMSVSEELAFRVEADRTANNSAYTDDTYQPMWQAHNLPWQRADQGRAQLPGLGRKLLMIARVIRQQVPLQMRRQLFYASLGGFDTHDHQNADLPALLAELSMAIKGFYDVINGLGLSDRVTTFTGSDFGRTLSNNGDGTDHAWGGHQYVIGGKVRGGQVYGRMPHLGITANPDNVGYGQLVPTLSCDQYAATLSSWFGVAPTDRADIFPNLQFMTGPKMAIEGPDLGFMDPVV